MATGLTPASLTSTTIDDLPECLLLHMFSFLPTIDAINTNSVSSNWRHLWILIPTLDLSIISFATRNSNCNSQPPSQIRQLFAEFITRLLFLRTHYSCPLHKFQLSFDYKDYDCHKDYVDGWIRYVIDLNCKFLCLNLKNDSYSYSQQCTSEDDDEDYDFDKFCVYRLDFSSLLNSSVEVLKLQGCNFSSPSARISSLKSLYLENYEFFMDESNVSELIPFCVNLEFLSIQGSGGWRSLKIASLSLKELILSIHRVPRAAKSCVEICAPNLCKVSFSYFFVGKCILRDAKSLVEAHVLDFSYRNFWNFACWSNLIVPLANVERLTVQNMWIWFKFDQLDDQSMSDDGLDNKSEPEFNEDPDILISGKVPVSEEIFSDNFGFNNLKYLRILTGYGKRDMLGLELCLEMCPKLETLILEYEYERGDEDDMIEMSTSRPIILQIQNLKQVELRKFKGTRNEVHVVGLLKKHKVVLETIIAFPAKENQSLGKPIIL